MAAGAGDRDAAAPARLKPAYLIHGDDHGAIAERRAGLRALAEAQSAGGGLELLEGERATPEAAAGTLAAMTLSVGRRVIIVEGVERWRESEVEKHLRPALRGIPPDTTLALFAREEGRAKAPAAAHAAVKEAGGQIVAQMAVKPWELPRWVREQARRVGLELDAAAAKALVSQVGDRPQRLLRELEKLSLEGPPAGGGAPARAVRAEEVEERAAQSAEWRAYALADSLVAADAREAERIYLRLRQQGERLSGLTYLMASRLREALGLSLRLRAGCSTAELKRTLRMPARAADRLLADVSRSDPERLRAALLALAELEVDARGGAPVAAARSALAGLDEDTLALRSIERICG
jgi:DNA polymerase III subunit delta